MIVKNKIMPSNSDYLVKPYEYGTTASSRMNFFKVLTKHIICASIVFVSVLCLTSLYLLLTPPKYIASSQLFITYNDSSSSADSYSNMNSASSYISSQITSYTTLAKTETVLEPVIKELGLTESVSELGKNLSISNPAATSILVVSAIEKDPRLAADISNAISVSLQKVIETSLYSDTVKAPVKVSIIQSAQIPTLPSSPNVPIILLGGILGGLILGIVAALLKDFFSRKIQDESELVEYINAPTLGRIPESDLVNTNAAVIVNEPGSPIAEDYRRICTNLSFISPISGTHSRLVVISAVGVNEGKTTTSVNIATALAENGSTVLLIDADLRHPSVANKLDIDGSVGLAHVLSGQASVKDVVQRFWKSNLHVMPAGPKPPNAAQLLNSQIMTELINHALQQYDYVIIDTAPLIVANDAAIFAKQGGGLVLVSRRGYTMKKQLTESGSELSNLHVEVTGFIFNGAKEDKKLGNSSYYYYYTNDDKGEHAASREAKGKRNKK